jgi:hypothetical protein
MLRQKWETWKVFSATLGDFQSRIVLMLLYFTVVAPFGLGLRLLSDPLRIKGSRQETAWLERAPIQITLDEARQQF